MDDDFRRSGAQTTSAIVVAWAMTDSDPAKRQRIGKIWSSKGKWPVTDGAKRQAYFFERKSYLDLKAFRVDLSARSRDGGFALVAGSLRPGLEPLGEHRRVAENFVDEPCWVFALDFDGLAAKKAGKRLDRPADFEGALDQAFDLLPTAFAADFIAYATSSTGLETNARGEPANGRAWFRLVFLLSRPLTYAGQKQIALALKQRAGLDCLDMSIYTLPQFSFIARPGFPAGMTDPIERPVSLYEGAKRRIDVDALLSELGVDLTPEPRGGTRKVSGRAERAEERLLHVDAAIRGDLIEQLVRAIPNDIEEHGGDWLGVAHAIKGSIGNDWGEDLWLEFCARWTKGTTDPDEDRRVWSSVYLEDGHAGVNTLIRLAQQAGTPEAIAALEAVRQAQAEAAFDKITPEMLDEIEAEGDPEWLQGLNAHYAFIHDRPGAVFDLRGSDKAIVTPLSITEFNNRFANKFESVSGKKRLSISKRWFVHPRRREYRTAGDYPIGKEPKGALNLWTGLPIAPKPGAWPTIREFLREVICGGDAAHFDYLRDLLFWKIQNPTKNPEVAVALQSRQGHGKGTFGKMLERLFGSKRYQQFIRADDATAKHNADIEGKTVLFYDEVFFGHDRRLLGRLKGEITERWLPIEPKGVNRYHVRNIALRVYASNEIAHIPIDLDDRRVFALEVSDLHAKVFAYFAKLTAAIEGDELAALVHDALSADLSGFESVRREPPKTKARARLAAATARPEEEYLAELLERGEPLALSHLWSPRRYPRMPSEPKNPWRDGQVTVDRDMLFDDYLAWMRNRQTRRPSVNGAEFHGIVQGVLGRSRFRSQQVKEIGGGGKRRFVLLLASLDDCREAFDQHAGREHEWSDAVSTDDELEDEDPG